MSDAFRIRLEKLEALAANLALCAGRLEGRIAILERRLDDVEPVVAESSAELARKQSHAVIHKGHGKFIVVNSDGEQAVEELFSREEAHSVAEQLNALS